MINEQMIDVELYGLELKTYCSKEEGINVMVPQIIGLTSEVVSKGKVREKKVWTEDEIIEYFKSLPNPNLRGRLIKVLEWTKENNILAFSRSPTKVPIIKLQSRETNIDVFRIYGDTGKIEVVLGKEYTPFKDDAKRIELFNELHRKGWIPPDVSSPDEIKATKYLTKKLDEFSDEEIEELLRIIKKYTIG